MATVRTEGIKRGQGSGMDVSLMLMTSLGQFPVELKVGDHGSMGETEKAALQELKTVLEESLEAVRRHLG